MLAAVSGKVLKASSNQKIAGFVKCITKVPIDLLTRPQNGTFEGSKLETENQLH
jgi:hypothetical protein